MKKNSILIVSAIAGGIGALIGAGVILHKKGVLKEIFNKKNSFVVVDNSDTPFPTENDIPPEMN